MTELKFGNISNTVLQEGLKQALAHNISGKDFFTGNKYLDERKRSSYVYASNINSQHVLANSVAGLSCKSKHLHVFTVHLLQTFAREKLSPTGSFLGVHCEKRENWLVRGRAGGECTCFWQDSEKFFSFSMVTSVTSPFDYFWILQPNTWS